MYVFLTLNPHLTHIHIHLRSPSRVQAPPVNLKERIAALQQRTNASTSATSPSSSTTNAPSLIPVPSPTGHSTSNTNGNLREKIARFEKKGGVPVPRGSFGLGAPPPTDGHPRRQGELYGNRIPQPVRVVSGPAHAPGSGSGAQQRAQSPLGHGHAPLTGTGTGTGTGASGDKRRSFSLSNVNVMMSSDYSDGGGTPLTSPSLSSPPSSPGSASDTVALDGIPHIAAIPPPPSTFATALEFARSVEKAAHHDPVLTAASLSAAVGDDEHEQDRDQSPIVPVLPAIVVSQGEGDIVAEPTELPPVEEEEAEVSGTEGADEDATHAVAHDSPSTREDSPDQHPEPPSSTSPSVPPSIDLTIGIQADAPLDPSLSPSLSASVFDLNTAASSSPSPVPSPRKVLLRAAGLGSPPTDAVSEQPAPSIASELMLSDDESSSTGVSPVMAIALGSPASHSEGSTSLAQVAEEILQKKAEAAPEAEAEAEADRGAPEATAGLKSKKAPPPALALEMDGVTVPLSPAVDSDDAIPSSQLQRSTGDTSINTKEALKDIEQPEIRVEPSVAAVEEQQPSSPTTPHAPHAPLPIAQEPTPSHHPPSSPPSSLAPHSLNGTSIRPVSMIEFSPSPSHVQFAHRVTPSTSRGVPMFLPATDPVSANGLTRKSDLVYYPPTPPDKQLEFEIDEEDRHEVGNTQGVKTYREEEEEGEPGSVTIIHQRSNSATRQTSSSFRAVVHNKIREVPPILNHGPLVPQTPPIRRAASALPLNHGTPSLTTGVTHTYTTSGLPVIPPSPGFTELADLLQSTVLLEQTLEQGTLPTESSALNSGVPRIVNTAADDDGDISREILMRRADGVEVRRLSREEAEENRRTLAKLQAKREEQAKSKLRSTFRNTLARAKEVAGVGSGPGVTASMYIDGSGPAPQQQQEQQLYSKRFKSPSVPHLMDPATESGSSGVPNGFLRSKTPENQIGTAKPASLASKSPKTRFPSFRRLASSSKSSSGSKEGYGGGHGHTRNSVSTSSEISSEDSAPTAVTPPDLASEFGDGVKGGRAGDSGAGGLSWPSISPSKKGKDGLSGGNNSIARAATFAGKMWQRARTKSGGSTLSVHSTVGECAFVVLTVSLDV